jgi:hypothetical protein
VQNSCASKLNKVILQSDNNNNNNKVIN